MRTNNFANIFCTNIQLSIHIQHKFGFHVSITNNFFSSYLHIYVSPVSSVEDTGVESVCTHVCVSLHQEEAGGLVSRRRSPSDLP